MFDIVSPSHNPEADRALLVEVRDYLARREALNSIQLSMVTGRDAFNPDFTMLVARLDAGIAGIATLAGPFNMLLSHIEDEAAIPALVDAVIERGVAIPGVMGPVGASGAFADAWVARTGGSKSPGDAQRILATSAVQPPVNVPGSWRQTAPDDGPLLSDWFAAFLVEAEGAAPEDARRAAEQRFDQRGDGSGALIWLDDAGTPVSIARYKRPTLTGISIGPVYTPPEHRRHGYAAAVTAAATQLCLDQGHAFVCLYTNAANATANHVYESIGYEFVADSMIWRFTPG